MNVICLNEPAFYQLLDEVIMYVNAQSSDLHKEEWVNGSEAMRLLNIRSKTTLQTLRDTGKIRFSQPQKRVILYDRKSISTYLDNNAKNTF